MKRYKASTFVIPTSTAAVLLSSSRQPDFVQASTKFHRAAYEPSRAWLVTERVDPKDAPEIYNYNVYDVVAASSGTLISTPQPSPSTFIPHRLVHPSTWFDSL